MAETAPMIQPGRGDLLDIMLVALAVGLALAGYRRGLIVGALSAAGLLIGAVIGLQLAPPLARMLIGGPGHDPNAQDALGQRMVAVIVVVASALLVELLAVEVGGRIRAVMARAPARAVDAIGGAVFEVVAFLVVAWLLASAVALQPVPHVADQIRRSLVLNAVDAAAPQSLRQLSAQLSRLLQRHAMPYLLDPFGPLPSPSPRLPPPDAGVVPPALRASGASVLKVTGIAEACDRGSAGSGFVFAPRRVMTNAHVVAGVSSPAVALPGGGSLPARVVVYDPDRDLAVLYVPGLTRPPLRFGAPAAAGTSAVVAGYPQDGPLTAVPARVAGKQRISGPNIYQSRRVTREVYTLRARVLPGNSGGPVLSRSGVVYGVVFAAALELRDVGFALTAAEAAPVVRKGATATAAVSTGACN